MARNETYDAELRELQIALVRHQVWAIRTGAKALVILEGRDGSGKYNIRETILANCTVVASDVVVSEPQAAGAGG